MEEIWRDIPQYEGMYQVSSKGRVRSLDRTLLTANGEHKMKGRVLSPNVNNSGYYYVTLSKDRRHWCAKVHRLVATAFIPNPDNLPEVNHRDGNKLNCCIENLEWCNHSDNHKHSFRMGLSKVGVAQKAKRKSVLQIDAVTGEVVREWDSIADANRHFYGNPRNTSIYRCIHGEYKTASGWKWRYRE